MGIRAATLWWRAGFALVLAAAPAWANGNGSGCTLRDLYLRYNDRPIALEPAYSPYIFEYSATMDFSMDAYFVSARPDTGCDVDGTPPVAVRVDIGGNSTLRIYARSAETQEIQAYLITVWRLLGSETDLSLLRVEGGTMSPIFDPLVRSYEVKLGLDFDEIMLVYRLRDSEQRMHGAAEEEVPMSGFTTTPLPDTQAAPRKLESPGEVQHSEESLNFMLDVGFTRPITLTVQCADATQANIGAYRLVVHRAVCSRESPYFDASKRMCVNFCPSGFYKSIDMSRCAKCNTNCEECASLESCRMCKADTVDYEYLVEPDGSCKAFANHVFKKYKWWCTGLGVCLILLLLIGCASICQACCASERTYKQFRTYSDSDDETNPVLGQSRGGAQGSLPQRAVGGRLGRY